jgi:hypothetical protein
MVGSVAAVCSARRSSERSFAEMRWRLAMETVDMLRAVTLKAEKTLFIGSKCS